MVGIQYVLASALCCLSLNVLPADEPINCDTWKIQFEGNESFTANSIRAGLAIDVITQQAATMAAIDELAIQDYCSLIERRIVRGYHANGYRDVWVSVNADPNTGTLTATIHEDRYWSKRDITVTGLSESENEYLASLMRHSADGENPLQKRHPKLAFWKPKSCMSFADSQEEYFGSTVQEALTAIGYPAAAYTIEFLTASNEDQHTVNMRIHVSDPGPTLTVGEIAFTGLVKHSPAQVREFLELKSGMPWTLQLQTSITPKLLDSGRFLMAEVTTAPFLFDPSQPREMNIKVREYDAVAPLGEELTDNQQALMKLSEWLSNWHNGDDNLQARITGPTEKAGALVQALVPGEFQQFCNPALATGMPGTFCAEFTTSPQEGSILTVTVTDPQGQVTARSTLMMTNSLRGIVSWQSNKKWLQEDQSGLDLDLKIDGLWATDKTPLPSASGDDRLAQLLIGFRIGSKRNNGARSALNCTAAAIDYLVLDATQDVRVENNLVKFILKSGELDISPITGSLSRFCIAMEGVNINVSTGKKLVADEQIRLQNETRDWPNQCQPGQEWPALAAMILEVVKEVASEDSDAVEVGLDFLRNEAAVKHIAAALADVSSKSWFSIPQKNGNPQLRFSFPGNILPLFVNCFPAGSFTQRFCLNVVDRRATGNPLLLKRFLDEMLTTQDQGAVWFDYVAQGAEKRHWRPILAEAGLQRLSTESFQRDVAAFINETSCARKLLCSVMVWLQQSSDEDAERIAKVIEKRFKDENEQPVNVRPLLVLIRGQRDKAPEEVLTLIAPFVWENGLRDWVEADLKEMETNVTRSDNSISADKPADQHPDSKTHLPLPDLPVSLHKNGVVRIMPTSVVAMVNGEHIFAVDVLGGVLRRIESDPKLTDDQRQTVLTQSLRNRTRAYAEDTLVVQAFEAAISEDRQREICDSLEPAFKAVCEKMKQDNKLNDDEYLEKWLEAQGFTLREMKETFIRRQLVAGYIQSKAVVSNDSDRIELEKYYQDHIDQYTPDQEVRFAEIVVRFTDHGDRKGAEEVMAKVMQRLGQKEDFGTVASELSDFLSAEKQGERGWIKRGTLADNELESMLFDMPAGTMTSVQVQDDRLEVYRVLDRRDPEKVPFESVEKEIKAKMLADLREAAQKQVVDDLRAKSSIVTIFDNEDSAAKSGQTSTLQFANQETEKRSAENAIPLNAKRGPGMANSVPNSRSHFPSILSPKHGQQTAIERIPNFPGFILAGHGTIKSFQKMEDKKDQPKPSLEDDKDLLPVELIPLDED